MNNELRHIANEDSPYVIFTSRDQLRTRLGWISPSTGLTYCGICLRAEVHPRVGADCAVCGAHVVHVLEVSENPSELQRVWKSVFPPHLTGLCRT